MTSGCAGLRTAPQDWSLQTSSPTKCIPISHIPSSPVATSNKTQDAQLDVARTQAECNGSISGSPRPCDPMVLRAARLVRPRCTSSATNVKLAANWRSFPRHCVTTGIAQGPRQQRYVHDALKTKASKLRETDSDSHHIFECANWKVRYFSTKTDVVNTGCKNPFRLKRLMMPVMSLEVDTLCGRDHVDEE